MKPDHRSDDFVDAQIGQEDGHHQMGHEEDRHKGSTPDEFDEGGGDHEMTGRLLCRPSASTTPIGSEAAMPTNAKTEVSASPPRHSSRPGEATGSRGGPTSKTMSPWETRGSRRGQATPEAGRPRAAQ